MLVKLNGYNSLLIFPADLFDPISPDAAHCLGLTFRESLARTSLGQYAYCAPHNGETSYCRLSPNWKKRFRVIDRSKPRRRVNRTISWGKQDVPSSLSLFLSRSFECFHVTLSLRSSKWNFVQRDSTPFVILIHNRKRGGSKLIAFRFNRRWWVWKEATPPPRQLLNTVIAGKKEEIATMLFGTVLNPFADVATSFRGD